MDRRTFLTLSGIGAAGLLLPNTRLIAAEQLLSPVDAARNRRLADTALTTAKSAGASYCDVRVGRYLRQFVITREAQVENVVNAESSGVGVRVLADGAWGFAATNTLTSDGVATATRQAVAIAKANARLGGTPVQLAPVTPAGQVSWKTPIKKNAMEVPLQDKVALLMDVNAAALNAGATFVASRMFAINEQKYFASSDGSYIDQDVHRLWLPFTVTAVDKASGKFRTRDGLSSPMGMGYEYLDGAAGEKHRLPGGLIGYGRSYDAREDAIAAAKQAREKLTAPSVKAGKYDLVIDPSNLFLTIHESVGHPLELDRVLGYEANYAGTSFATLDKRDAGYRWGSDAVTFVADKTQPGSLGAVGYDDEGVKTKQWDLVKDGILVDYQCTRDQAHLLGKTASDGCSYADSWSNVQFQRVPNVSLAPGRTPLAVADMIKNVERGLYIHGRGSYSIDQQRYNAQFGGQLFYEIENGQVTRLVEDGAYQIRTPEFWNACSAVCDQRDFRLGGSFFDGKGQPSQVSAVSHGSSTARFDGINVINTARSLG
ncbi:TldD/PmbA family protein [Xanthomonas campestris]|uniref:TldD/PmbA family protein n=1 Tax=Xanthomonas campestris TaxID=339 RepID=UPI0005E001C0|nr:TldD/PmbA family protein [Xanthomonas campestris]MCC5053193.1 TldD/PmbA family protein [Xanthomonas campestris pv. aberrans]MDM7674795.1 TldD/PmbA family protein [Xanthomonas campestris pv. campestris]MDM7688705.1 TldD/PmbA family protein [Xanthomonas campestris pv. campestris]MDM7705407.1 TldD/PmbA family protein [Xanthomonas campestris pv. campestris]MDM7709782.1 TldD/PmbA family protein [Xanthomonas campestris pv. campestris]